MKQMTLSTSGFDRYSKTTRRATFLAEMERVVPWGELCALIEPFYPKAGNGRRPIGVERMLRIYFLQQWFNLSDPGVEEALYDSLAMRSFVAIDLGREPAPDETTVCKFSTPAGKTRHWPQALRGGTRPSGGARHQGFQGHDRGCDDHQCPELDQECQRQP